MRKLKWLLCLIVLLVFLPACGKSTAEKWQEQYDLGQQYLLEENYEEAIVAFTAAIEIDPKQADAYIGRGDAYILSGETEEHLTQALADYRQVLELDEKSISAYLGIADVYIRQGDYDAALEILNEGLEKTGENEEIAAKIEEIESGNITDSSGKLRRQSSYDESGVLLWYHEFSYDEEAIRTAVTSFDGAGNETGHVDLRYNEAGQTLTGYSYVLDGTGRVCSNEYVYDESGNLIQSKHYNPDGEIDYTIVYEYESNGNRKSSWYDSSGELSMSGIVEYDEQGRVLKDSRYDAENELIYYYRYEYDGDKLVQYGVYEPDDQIRELWVYQFNAAEENIGYIRYDSSGNIIESVVNE